MGVQGADAVILRRTDGPALDTPAHCPVCGQLSALLDVVDFNKSCEEARGRFLGLSGISVYYCLCDHCAFCFAPEFAHWKQSDFAQRIYNRDYVQVDPDYLDVRPRSNAQSLITMFGERGRGIRHLDYGGGSGLMSRILQEAGWRSASYDPFASGPTDPGALGQFDLVTAYEVFEHVPDVRGLVATLSRLLAADGLVLFSTLISDGHIASRQRITWWYASPRNGHISLFSRKSLALIGAHHGFSFGSFSDGFHAFWRTVPPWARHLVRAG